ncbi:MAG TPA: aquaporin Z [Friedmanniella sp.]
MPTVPAPPSDVRLGGRLGAEFLGTFGLVFGGCGSAVLAAKFLTEDKTQLGIGFVGVALAFGLTVLTGAFAFGHVSGGHFNPAVTIGLAVARRFGWAEVLPYIVTQVVAATVAGGVLFVIATGSPSTTAAQLRASGFATNGYGVHSPGHYGLGAALLTEIVLTAAFLYVILGATDDRTNKAFAPVAIGLALTLIHLVSIPVTNTSVNPARSLGVAWYVGGPALKQVWLFIVAPVVGAVIAGATYARITGADAGAQHSTGVANNPG